MFAVTRGPKLERTYHWLAVTSQARGEMLLANGVKPALRLLAPSLVKTETATPFSKYPIDWNMIMLKDFTVTIMHAGNASRNINIGRGCRQGDPIASLIFILCIEILFHHDQNIK